MTLLRPLLLAALLAAVCAAPRAARAQEEPPRPEAPPMAPGMEAPTRPKAPPPRPESRRLAVEVVDDRHGHPLRLAVLERAPENMFSQFGPPRPIAGWERPKERTPLTGVRLRASYEGEAVRVRVAAVFDDSLQADAPGPKYGPREEPLASLLAREGETLHVEGFERFGARPLVLRVVRSEPEPEMPFVPAPARAVSPLKSVEVVSYSAEGAHLERGVLTLLNVSPKNIVALEVGVPGRGMSLRAQAAAGRPLMQPGGTHKTEINLGRGWSETGGRYEPEPQPDAVAVVAVLFEDGSYEGDLKAAAQMAAWQRGRLAQLARVLGLLRGALDATAPGGADALDALKSEADALRIDAEPSLVDGLLSQFTGLPEEEGRRLFAAALLDGLRAGKDESLHVIRRAAAAGSDPRRQLGTALEQIEQRVGRRERGAAGDARDR